jgi:inositol 3-alpha-galactosyltransferase
MRIPRYAYATLITKDSYLTGVLVLSHTLRKHSSLPLIVVYTSHLSHVALRALEIESNLAAPLILKQVDPLVPVIEGKLIAERFRETWTKLRVFELWDRGDGTEWDRICYLDADIAIYGCIDDVFAAAGSPPTGQSIKLDDPRLDKKDSILAAAPICCCNLDHDAWAPADWNKENCPYTALQHPMSLDTTPTWEPEKPEPWRLLNGGVFVFVPSEDLWNSMMKAFDQWGRDGQLAAMKFPDQDFLAKFWDRRWKTLGWRFNALKTMRYWHPQIWRDEEVVALHYIVDKPWVARIGRDGLAGYLKRDGQTHERWWREWCEWENSREKGGQQELLKLVRRGVHVAGYEEVTAPDMLAIGSGVQDLAKHWGECNPFPITGTRD